MGSRGLETWCPAMLVMDLACEKFFDRMWLSSTASYLFLDICEWVSEWRREEIIVALEISFLGGCNV